MCPFTVIQLLNHYDTGSGIANDYQREKNNDFGVAWVRLSAVNYYAGANKVVGQKSNNKLLHV